MKILYCYRYAILGGVCTQLINRWKHLQHMDNLEAHFLFAQEHGAAEELSNYGTVHIDRNLDTLQDWVISEAFDLVIIIDSAEYFKALAGKNRSYKLIAEVHTSITKNLLYLNDYALYIDLFMTPSEYMRELLVKEFCIPEQQIHVIHNSIDTELFAPQSKKAGADRPVLMWVGKIDEHKNWPVFIKICQKLKAQGRIFEAWIIGGHGCLPETAENLLQAVDDAELSSCFSWFPKVSQTHMPAFYQFTAESGGCTIVTSKCESFGMSLVESLCCGCPAVVSAVGALPEIGADLNDEPARNSSESMSPVDYFEISELDKASKTVANLLDSKLRLNAASINQKLFNKYSLTVTGKHYYDFLKQSA